MKCTIVEWCRAEDGHDNDCNTMTTLALLKEEREDAKTALARGVREDRAAIVAFLRRNGMLVHAERVERCEHAEDALALARVDHSMCGSDYCNTTGCEPVKVPLAGGVLTVTPAEAVDPSLDPALELAHTLARESITEIVLKEVEFHLEAEMCNPHEAKARARSVRECMTTKRCRRCVAETARSNR